MFDPQKVTQMAAYFLQKRGGRMSYLKLMKLLYLSDREAMSQFGESISDDQAVSMPHGPVLSQTLDLINGDSSAAAWNAWIAGEANYEVSLKVNINREALDELSDADLQIMDVIWARCGRMTRFQIRDYTHEHCPEWQDPNGSSFPISAASIFKAVGKTEEQAQELTRQLIARRHLNSVIRNLK